MKQNAFKRNKREEAEREKLGFEDKELEDTEELDASKKVDFRF